MMLIVLRRLTKQNMQWMTYLTVTILILNEFLIHAIQKAWPYSTSLAHGAHDVVGAIKIDASGGLYLTSAHIQLNEASSRQHRQDTAGNGDKQE